MADKLEGKRIPYFGDFVLFDEIGRGGMGVVYDAQQSSLDRRVALKLLHANVAGAESAVQRLRIEAEAVARLDHPSIVPIYETGEHEGQHYLAMQLVEGQSLAQRMAQEGRNIDERAAATLMAKVARAVHHAHQRGVLHRDLKPGNILLDQQGEPHLIDFGLAKCLEQDSGITLTGAFLGTPAFASPEQAAGQRKSITTASDVYSLGAVLYALLAGQPPFVGDSAVEVIEKARKAAPIRPRSMRPGLSRDLEIICLKCLEKDPTRRYATALAMADDLERFLKGEPISARQAGGVERLWMWSRRNPAHAALWATASLAMVGLLVGVFVWRTGRAREAEAQAQLERQRRLAQARPASHSAGWFTQAWSNVQKAADVKTALPFDDIRNQAAAILAGLDADPDGRTNFNGFFITSDSQGNRWLLGNNEGATLWQPESKAAYPSSRHEALGPIGFSKDGTAVHMLYDTNHHSILLADILNPRTVREWRIPAAWNSAPCSDELLKFQALTPDGSVGICLLTNSAGDESLVSLRSDSSVLPLGGVSNSITCVAISSDGSLCAAGERTGAVTIWSASDGKPVAAFQVTRSAIYSMAFKRMRRVCESARGATADDWLLAVGDSGSLITVWNLQTHAREARLDGYYHTYALAFSLDGTILACGGRGPVRLWDWVAERPLLDINSGDYVTGLAFSPDGTRLVVGSLSGQGPSGAPNVSIWHLDFGRGIRTLRGLTGPISKVCLSSNLTRIAALSHRWEIGVWDATSGHLLLTIEAPEGQLADNAALALSPNGKRLAFASGQAARIWDTDSGTNLVELSLPSGLADVFGFPDENHLFLFRQEGKSPNVICSIRDLLHPAKPIEIQDFNREVFATAASPNGLRFIAEGVGQANGELQRRIICYEAATGKGIWTVRSSKTAAWGAVIPDSAGEFVVLTTPNSATNSLVISLSSGEIQRQLPWLPDALNSRSSLYATSGFLGDRGSSLFVEPAKSPVVTLRIDEKGPEHALFSPQGDLLIWGNADGTVTICHLNKIREQLGRAGLAW